MYKKGENWCECAGNRDFRLLTTTAFCAAHNFPYEVKCFYNYINKQTREVITATYPRHVQLL
jgi:hypothetical protein